MRFENSQRDESKNYMDKDEFWEGSLLSWNFVSFEINYISKGLEVFRKIEDYRAKINRGFNLLMCRKHKIILIKFIVWYSYNYTIYYEKRIVPIKE